MLKVIKNIKKHKVNRSVLVKVLKEQNSSIILSKNSDENIEFLLDKAEIPKTLSECGVRRTEKDSFLDFVEQVKGAFDFNPVGFNQDDIKNLLI